MSHATVIIAVNLFVVLWFGAMAWLSCNRWWK